MLDRLAPRRPAEEYRGHFAALWILALLALAKTAMGANALFNGRALAISADGVPLDAFPHAAARAFLALFAVWGFGQILLGLAATYALLRDRALVPVVFALLLVENVGRKAIFHYLPYAASPTTTNVVVNATFVALMVAGLALSLRRPSGRPTGAAG